MPWQPRTRMRSTISAAWEPTSRRHPTTGCPRQPGEWPDMSFALTWLPKVLGDANLKVALVDGWENRGRGDVGNTLGVICHHTAGPRLGNMPSLDVLMRGRPDLSG